MTLTLLVLQLLKSIAPHHVQALSGSDAESCTSNSSGLKQVLSRMAH